jgi:hypothetical protein
LIPLISASSSADLAPPPLLSSSTFSSAGSCLSSSSTSPSLIFPLPLDAGAFLVFFFFGSSSSASCSSSSSSSSSFLRFLLEVAFALEGGLFFETGALPLAAAGPSGFLSFIRASSYFSPRSDLRCLQLRALTGAPLCRRCLRRIKERHDQ